MPNKKFTYDIQGAIDAGYTIDDISDLFKRGIDVGSGKKFTYDIQGAMSAGYTIDDISNQFRVGMDLGEMQTEKKKETAPEQNIGENTVLDGTSNTQNIPTNTQLQSQEKIKPESKPKSIEQALAERFGITQEVIQKAEQKAKDILYPKKKTATNTILSNNPLDDFKGKQQTYDPFKQYINTDFGDASDKIVDANQQKSYDPFRPYITTAEDIITDNTVNFNEHPELNYYNNVNKINEDYLKFVQEEKVKTGDNTPITKEQKNKILDIAIQEAGNTQAGLRIKSVANAKATLIKSIDEDINNLQKLLESTSIGNTVPQAILDKALQVREGVMSGDADKILSAIKTYIDKKTEIERKKSLSTLLSKPEVFKLDIEDKGMGAFAPKSNLQTAQDARNVTNDYTNAYIDRVSDKELAPLKNELRPYVEYNAVMSNVQKGITTNQLPNATEIGFNVLSTLDIAGYKKTITLNENGVSPTATEYFLAQTAGNDAIKSAYSIIKAEADKSGSPSMMQTAKLLSSQIKTNDEILNNNEAYVIQQYSSLLSDEIAKNYEKYFGYSAGEEAHSKTSISVAGFQKALGAYDIDDNMIRRAGEALHLDMNIVNKITDNDISSGSIFGSIYQNSIGDLISGGTGILMRAKLLAQGKDAETANAITKRYIENDFYVNKIYRPAKVDELQQGATIIDTDPTSETYLQDIQNPHAGDWNPNVFNIANAVTGGVSMVLSLGYGGMGVSKLGTATKLLTTEGKLIGQATNILNEATKIGRAVEMAKATKEADLIMARAKNIENVNNNIGQFTYGFVVGLDRNIRQAEGLFDGQENAGAKTMLYGTLFGVIENAVELMGFSEIKFAKKLFSGEASQSAMHDLITTIYRNGARGISREEFVSGTKKVIKSLAEKGSEIKDEIVEEIATNIFQKVLDKETGANEDENSDFIKEQIDTALHTALQMSLLTLLKGGGHFATRGKLMMNIAQNKSDIINAITDELLQGNITLEESIQRQKIVNTISDLYKQLPTQDPLTQRKLSTEDRIAYLSESAKARFAESDKKKTNDATVISRLDDIIKDATEAQKNILTNGVANKKTTPTTPTTQTTHFIQDVKFEDLTQGDEVIVDGKNYQVEIAPNLSEVNTTPTVSLKDNNTILVLNEKQWGEVDVKDTKHSQDFEFNQAEVGDKIKINNKIVDITDIGGVDENNNPTNTITIKDKRGKSEQINESEWRTSDIELHTPFKVDINDVKEGDEINFRGKPYQVTKQETNEKNGDIVPLLEITDVDGNTHRIDADLWDNFGSITKRSGEVTQDIEFGAIKHGQVISINDEDYTVTALGSKKQKNGTKAKNVILNKNKGGGKISITENEWNDYDIRLKKDVKDKSLNTQNTSTLGTNTTTQITEAKKDLSFDKIEIGSFILLNDRKYIVKDRVESKEKRGAKESKLILLDDNGNDVEKTQKQWETSNITQYEQKNTNTQIPNTESSTANEQSNGQEKGGEVASDTNTPEIDIDTKIVAKTKKGAEVTIEKQEDGTYIYTFKNGISSIKTKEQHDDFVKNGDIVLPSKPQDTQKVEELKKEVVEQKNEDSTTEEKKEQQVESSKKVAKDFVGKKVIINGKKGIVVDEGNGKYSFEQGNKIIEIDGNTEIEPIITDGTKIPKGEKPKFTIKGNVIEINGTEYSLGAINKNTKGDVTYITLIDSNGKRHTIKDVDMALDIAISLKNISIQKIKNKKDTKATHNFISVAINKLFKHTATTLLENVPDEVDSILIAMRNDITALAPTELKSMIFRALEWIESTKSKVLATNTPKEEKDLVIKTLEEFNNNLITYYDTIDKQRVVDSTTTTETTSIQSIGDDRERQQAEQGDDRKGQQTGELDGNQNQKHDRASEPIKTEQHQLPKDDAGERKQEDKRPEQRGTVNLQEKVDVTTFKVADIHQDPKRFQYKSDTDSKTGASEKLKDRVYQDALAGVITIWKDPADGKFYVINGHHRLDLAKRNNVQSINVQIIGGESAQDARVLGALQNIAEGQGTVIDAAKIFRDMKFDISELTKVGLSLTDSKTNDGMALSNLSQDLFDSVVNGMIAPSVGIIIGRNIKKHSVQEQFIKHIKGRKLNNSTIEVMAKDINASPVAVTKVVDLFGTTETEQAEYEERAKIIGEIINALSKVKNLLGKTAKGKEFLEQFGNKINEEKSKGASQDAAIASVYFDRLRHSDNNITQIINDTVNAIKKGEKRGSAIAKASELIIDKAKNFFQGDSKQTSNDDAGEGKQEATPEQQATANLLNAKTTESKSTNQKEEVSTKNEITNLREEFTTQSKSINTKNTLNRKNEYEDGAIKTRAENIEELANDGIFAEEREEIEQELVKEDISNPYSSNYDPNINIIYRGGKHYKEVSIIKYALNGYYVTKTEYDYSQFLKEKLGSNKQTSNDDVRFNATNETQEATPEQQAKANKILDYLKKKIPFISFITDAKEYADTLSKVLDGNTIKVMYIKVQGDVLGFVYGGKIYLDATKLTPETLAEEFTHLQQQALRLASKQGNKQAQKIVQAWDNATNKLADALISGNLKAKELLIELGISESELESDVYKQQAGESKTAYKERLQDEIWAKAQKVEFAKHLERLSKENKFKATVNKMIDALKDFAKYVGKQLGIYNAKEWDKLSLSELIERTNKELAGDKFLKELKENPISKSGVENVRFQVLSEAYSTQKLSTDAEIEQSRQRLEQAWNNFKSIGIASTPENEVKKHIELLKALFDYAIRKGAKNISDLKQMFIENVIKPTLGNANLKNISISTKIESIIEDFGKLLYDKNNKTPLSTAIMQIVKDKMGDSFVNGLTHYVKQHTKNGVFNVKDAIKEFEDDTLLNDDEIEISLAYFNATKEEENSASEIDTHIKGIQNAEVSKEREMLAIGKILSKDIDPAQFPNIIFSMTKGDNQDTAQTTSDVQGRDVISPYIKLTLDELRAISISVSNELQTLLGNQWKEKTLEYLESGLLGNHAVSIAVLNAMSQEIQEQLENNSLGSKKYDEILELRTRIDNQSNRIGRQLSLGMNMRRILRVFSLGQDMTSVYSEVILDDKTIEDLEITRKAIDEVITDDQLNTISRTTTTTTNTNTNTKQKTPQKQQTTKDLIDKLKLNKKSGDSTSELINKAKDFIKKLNC